MRCLRRLPAVIALLLAVSSLPAPAASRFLPGLKFRVFRTTHFLVYYHQGEEPRARRLAAVAEEVYATLPARLGLPAPRLTHVLLVDQDDSSNGWATPVPYNTVMVTAVWPAPSDLIGNTSEWLRLVFTHEFTHVLHLHQSRGWAKAVRLVFGRSPLAFPNLFLPQWEVEGLATFAETRMTGQGRLASGDSLALVRERAREVGGQRLAALNGGQVEWPGGTGAYLYGGYFAEYLANRFGDEKLGELARRTAGRLPYLASPAYREIFGTGLGDLWKDFQKHLTSSGGHLPGCAALPGCTRITHDGFWVETPRFTSDGRTLLYSISNPHDFPAVMRRDGAAAAARKVTRRYWGEQLGVARGIVFYDQAEYLTNVAWRSDLYAADIDGARVQRLTRGARLLAPDVSPDGRRLACIRVAPGGQRQLALFRIEGDRVGGLRLAEMPVPGSEPASWGSPRWSPDGKRLAVERRLAGGLGEIVVMDAESARLRAVTAAPRGRSITPAWLPDGRTILFASDLAGGPFVVYSLDLESGTTRRVLAVAGGALSPEPSPDGNRLVYVGYTADGYDLFSVPLQSALDAAVVISPPGAAVPGASGGRAAAEAAAASADGAAAVAGESRPYRPFYTLLPRAWSPAADTKDNGLRLGFSTVGVDILERHVFGVTALWRMQAGNDAMYGPHRARPDWSAFYVYDRWRPAPFLTAADETSFLPQFAASTRLAEAELRQQSLAFGVSAPFLLIGRRQLWQSALNLQRDTLWSRRGRQGYTRNAIQTAWAFENANVFGFSVSQEQGLAAALTSEQVRTALGADGDADAFTGELRGYLRLGGRHSVLAVRAAGGISSGAHSVARHFYLGGSQPASALVDFGSDAFSMLRGFEDHAYLGTRIAVANAEYRLPLWRIERGRGTWPLLVRTLHAAVFADAGNVWDAGGSASAWSDAKASFGAELSLDVVLGFGMPVSLCAGVSRPWDGRAFRSPVAYLRLGRSF